MHSRKSFSNFSNLKAIGKERKKMPLSNFRKDDFQIIYVMKQVIKELENINVQG